MLIGRVPQPDGRILDVLVLEPRTLPGAAGPTRLPLPSLPAGAVGSGLEEREKLDHKPGFGKPVGRMLREARRGQLSIRALTAKGGISGDRELSTKSSPAPAAFARRQLSSHSR